MKSISTIKDVAKDAGVSIATVSRVLNSNYYVSPDLVDKVMQSVKRLNYYPNSIARSLKNAATLTIGLIVSDISNSFFAFLARAIEDVIKEYNYNLIVCSTDNQQQKEYDYLQLLLEKQVDGLVLNISGTNNDFITQISNDIPIVLLGRRIETPQFKGDFVDSDNLFGSFTLTNHLLQLGHRSIALINGQQGLSSSQERYAGFAKALQAANLDIAEDSPYIYYGDFNRPESGELGASVLMNLPQPPTAILTSNNELALGALGFCKKNNIKIPQEVSFACYGDIAHEDLLFVRPSKVTMDPWPMGKRVADLMIERIEQKNQMSNREILFTPQLVVGDGVSEIVKK